MKHGSYVPSSLNELRNDRRQDVSLGNKGTRILEKRMLDKTSRLLIEVRLEVRQDKTYYGIMRKVDRTRMNE